MKKFVKNSMLFLVSLLFMSNFFIIGYNNHCNISGENTKKLDKNGTLYQDFYCIITRPIEGIYVNDQLIWTFYLINRPVVLGDITFNVDAWNTTSDIDRVEFSLKRLWNPIPIANCIDYDEPWEWTFNQWCRRGIVVLKATAYTSENMSKSDNIQIWMLS